MSQLIIKSEIYDCLTGLKSNTYYTPEEIEHLEKDNSENINKDIKK